MHKHVSPGSLECLFGMQRLGFARMGSLAVEIVAASATTTAVVVTLWTSHRALIFQRRGLQVEGRRQAAFDI